MKHSPTSRKSATGETTKPADGEAVGGQFLPTFFKTDFLLPQIALLFVRSLQQELLVVTN
jgi:hypothetical protein